MTKNRNIAILAGGNSSEEGISMKGAAQITKWLSKTSYNVYTILIKGVSWTVKHPELGDFQVSKDDFSVTINGEKVEFDCALIAIHGTPGENGLLQGYFEMLNIPYTTGGVMNTSVTFNKYFCKDLVRETGVDLAKGHLIQKGQVIDPSILAIQLGLPLFVKPNESGSSYGISKVKTTEDIAPAITKALAEDSAVIIEEFIAGRELTCGLVKTADKELIFPVTEIISKNEFFDYEAKYLNQSEEVTPADISSSLSERIQILSSKIYDKLNCRGIVRIDYIYSNDQLYFLEINTVPGMSEASIIPQQVKVYGKEMHEIFSMVIEDAIERKSA
ncbi:MAG: D-alanine--D-alanine ligase [Bacteroidales bacterium]|nr:MAG: D-alanine--D-alanine ligase [Bacteroidales bacterium]